MEGQVDAFITNLLGKGKIWGDIIANIFNAQIDSKTK